MHMRRLTDAGSVRTDGSNEAAVLAAAVATTLDGVEKGDIGPATCDTDADDNGGGDRVRQLQQSLERRLDAESGVTISFEIAMSSSALIGVVGDDDSDGPASTALASALVSALESGALASAIASAADEAGNAAMASVEAQSVSVVDISAATGGAVGLAETPAPTAPRSGGVASPSFDKGPTTASTTVVVLGVVVIVLALALIVVCAGFLYRVKQQQQQQQQQQQGAPSARQSIVIAQAYPSLELGGVATAAAPVAVLAVELPRIGEKGEIHPI